MRHLVFVLVCFLLACSKEPQPIHFGEDGCRYCKMIISDYRYGGELLTTKGKSYKFDSLECLAAYVLKSKEENENIHSLWTIDFNNPGNFLAVNQSWYLNSNLLKSPMGLNFTSYKDKNSAEKQQKISGGEIIRWTGVKNIVEKEWITD